MAGLVVDGGFDLAAFNAHVERELPAYAQPAFIRILPQIDVTGTFKQRKMDLVAEGYDPAKVKGPLYYRDANRGFVKVTKAGHEKILAGGVRL